MLPRSPHPQDPKTFLTVLTPREHKVLQLITEDVTSKDVARQLFVSTCTVRKLRENIMWKLEIHQVASLALYAIEKGLVGTNRELD